MILFASRRRYTVCLEVRNDTATSGTVSRSTVFTGLLLGLIISLSSSNSKARRAAFEQMFAASGQKFRTSSAPYWWQRIRKPPDQLRGLSQTRMTRSTINNYTHREVFALARFAHFRGCGIQCDAGALTKETTPADFDEGCINWNGFSWLLCDSKCQTRSALAPELRHLCSRCLRLVTISDVLSYRALRIGTTFEVSSIADKKGCPRSARSLPSRSVVRPR